MKNLTLPMALATVMLTLSAAHAVTVRNMTTNTVLFFDDFEGAASVSTVPAIDNSGDYDPAAITGSWTVSEASGQSIIQVTSSTTSPDPGPAQGDNYLRIFRVNDGSTILDNHNLDGVLSGAQSPGDVIRWSSMVYVPDDGANARGQFLLVGTGGDVTTARAWVRPDGSGNVFMVDPGLATVSDTGIDYTPGEWQLWEMEYVSGSNTFSVSVDGAMVSGLASHSSGDVNALLLINGSNTAGSIYFDDAAPIVLAVPEPACALLLMPVFGMAGLLLRRRARK